MSRHHDPLRTSLDAPRILEGVERLRIAGRWGDAGSRTPRPESQSEHPTGGTSTSSTRMIPEGGGLTAEESARTLKGGGEGSGAAKRPPDVRVQRPWARLAGTALGAAVLWYLALLAVQWIAHITAAALDLPS